MCALSGPKWRKVKKMPSLLKTAFQHALIVIITLVLTGIMGEILLRVKNSSQQNYVIEMWRYARELKSISNDTRFGHIHRPNSEATLQNIDIRINSLGLRGPEPILAANDVKKILILGSSITLGWGVEEDLTLSSRLERELGGNYAVFNGGVGNYNLLRSVNFFRERLNDKIKPDIVVVNYFINDAEYLGLSVDNFIFRNSQLAVTLYHVVQGFREGSFDMHSLINHYKDLYTPGNRGYKDMLKAIAELKELSEARGFRVIFSMIPDIHQLRDYPFDFIHDQMKNLADENGWAYIDFLDDLKDFEGPELWTIPGDPHPNALVHEIMARELATQIE